MSELLRIARASANSRSASAMSPLENAALPLLNSSVTRAVSDALVCASALVGAANVQAASARTEARSEERNRVRGMAQKMGS
jgi:hypothetical protein